MSIRIVLVDDHKILRDGLRLRLNQEPGLSVVGEAANAKDGYACIEKNKPDIAIIDVNLPGESGLALTGRIHLAWPEMRIIVLTGEHAETATQDALLAGANGFILKEDASDDLVRAISVVMAGKTYLTPDAATVVSQAMSGKSPAAKTSGLSERELSVLRGLAEGLSYKEIAARLDVSAKSVETYRARLVRKIGVNTRAELVRYAIRQGIVSA